LANNKIRGQWGERMAEDVLRQGKEVTGPSGQKLTLLEAAEPSETQTN
jgi:hypothetical protein